MTAMHRPSDAAEPVTLKTIASTLGVSVTTVTRALKDGHKVSPEMVRKIRETADLLGYVRNLDGVKLRTGKTYVAMAFLSFSNDEEIGDAGSVGLLNGIHRRFAGTDYAVRAAPVAIGEIDLDRVQDVVRGRNADGVILDHIELRDPRVEYLLQAEMPFVAFGRTEPPSEHPYFDLDNEFAAYQGTSALLDAGHRRIALIDGDLRYTFVRQRIRGYERALAERGIALDPALIRHAEIAADVARSAARELVQAGADGFVCVNELTFFGARAGARDMVGSRADQLGFSLRSGTNIGEYLGSPVYASHYSRLAAGWHLADLLLKRIEGAPIAACQRIERTTLNAFRKTHA